MRYLFIFVTIAVVVVLSLTACQPATSTPEPATPKAAVTRQVSKPAWEGDWEKTLQAAKVEGKVVAIASFGGESTTRLAKTFKDKYGLDVEFVIGRGPEIFAKVSNERRAGLFLEDVYLAGLSSIALVKDGGFLDPLRPLLILPEVVDTRAWLYGELGFREKEGLTLGYIIQPTHAVQINSTLVKPDEIKSYRDLLDPKWKGKIVVMDPTIGGAGTAFFMILWEYMGPELTREMVKQDLAVTESSRQQAEWLARGKYAISGTISLAALAEMVNAGAPIKIVIPREGTLTTASTGALAYMNKAPNPNAAKIFANWLLTREGQILMSQIFGAPSRRLDISYDWVDPAMIIQPGFKYIDVDTDEMIKKRLELQKLSREVWNIK